MIIRTLLLLVIAATTGSALLEEKNNHQLDCRLGDTIIVDADFRTINVSADAEDRIVMEAPRKICSAASSLSIKSTSAAVTIR